MMRDLVSGRISAGYVFTRPVRRADDRNADLLPVQLVSMCTCLAARFPEPGIFDAARYRESPSLPLLGLDEAAAADLRARALDAARSGALEWPDCFLTVADARRFLGAASTDPPMLVGLSLAAEHVAPLLAAAPRNPTAAGFEAVLQRGEPPEPGGELLGWELLAWSYSLSCSWLCNGLERLVHDQLGIRPRRHGLLASATDAARAHALIARPDVPKEPGLWLPWQLVRYA